MQRPPTTPGAWLLAYAASVMIAARRRPRIAFGLPLLGLVAGVALALTLPQRFPSSAAFVPDLESGRSAISSALGGLAAQLGATGGVGDTPQFYADLLQNRTTLLPLLYKRFPADVVHSQSAQRLIDLYDVPTPDDPRGRDAGLKLLARSIQTMVNPRTGVISFTVEARTPELAQALARDLLAAVDAVNVRIRQSRAGAQQKFMETRVADAAGALRVAEDRLRAFLATNRTFQSPSLQFEKARLERSLDLAQTLYVNLRRELDQAAIDAAKNTPSLIVLTEPMLVTRRSFPKRRFVTAAVLASAVLLTLAWLRVAESRLFAPDEEGEGTIRYEIARIRAARARGD